MSVDAIGSSASLGITPITRSVRDKVSMPSSSSDRPIEDQVFISAAAKARMKEEEATPPSIAEQIMEKGLYELITERRMEQIRAEARAEAMAQLSITEEELEEMGVDARVKAEAMIEEKVEERLKVLFALAQEAAREKSEKSQSSTVTI